MKELIRNEEKKEPFSRVQGEGHGLHVLTRSQGLRVYLCDGTAGQADQDLFTNQMLSTSPALAPDRAIAFETFPPIFR